MPLHRDIYWVGKQWAVTGHGLQACDQRLKGKLDIEVDRLWEEGLAESMQADGWLNIEDFAKALSLARARYPARPRDAAPLAERVPGLIETILEPPGTKAPGLTETGSEQTRSEEPSPKEAIPKADSPKETPVEEPKPAAQIFDLRITGWPAKFVPPWRVRNDGNWR